MKTASASKPQTLTLPNFLCIGTQKAGTTTLYEWLRQHPQVYVPAQKEAFFFDQRFDKGVEWYQETYFDKVEGEPCIGEISPHYIGHSQAAQRIYDTLGPSVKLILLVRNPAKRAYSEYMMRKKIDHEDTRLPFLEIFEQHAKAGIGRYVKLGYYAKHLKQFYAFFAPENIKVILFSDLIQHSETTAHAVYEFLNVSTEIKPKQVHANQGGLPRSKYLRFIYSQHPFFAWLRSMLGNVPGLKGRVKNAVIKKAEKLSEAQYKALNQQYYLEDIKELEQILGKDLSAWYQ